jgi:hypothetical protein
MPMMPMGPNGGMPPGPMPGGPAGPMPGGPMPPGAQGGIPPEYLLQQMLAAQGPEAAGPPEIVMALQDLLNSWTERTPNTIAGQYYQDLANVLAQFMG